MSFKDLFVILLVLAYFGVFRKPGSLTWITDLLVGLTVVLTIVKFIWLAKKRKEESQGK